MYPGSCKTMSINHENRRFKSEKNKSHHAASAYAVPMRRFPKIRGTFLAVPIIIEVIVFEDLYWGPPYFGKLPCTLKP